MTTQHTVPMHLLEPLLRDMVDTIGWDDTLAIVSHYGGTRLWVPVSPAEDHPLVKRVGLEAVHKLRQLIGSDWVAIPKAQAAMHAMRNAEICANPHGLTMAELARKHKLVERRIYQIRNEPDPTATQPRLFD